MHHRRSVVAASSRVRRPSRRVRWPRQWPAPRAAPAPRRRAAPGDGHQGGRGHRHVGHRLDPPDRGADAQQRRRRRCRAGSGGKGRQEIAVPVAELEGACPGAPAGCARPLRGSRGSLRRESRPTGSRSRSGPISATNSPRRPEAGDGLPLRDRDHRPGRLAPARRLPRQVRDRPAPATPSELLFCVMTCQAYHDRDHQDGHNIYPAMPRSSRGSSCSPATTSTTTATKPAREHRAGAAPLAADVQPAAAGGAAPQRGELLGEGRPRHAWTTIRGPAGSWAT